MSRCKGGQEIERISGSRGWTGNEIFNQAVVTYLANADEVLGQWAIRKGKFDGRKDIDNLQARVSRLRGRGLDIVTLKYQGKEVRDIRALAKGLNFEDNG